MVSPVQVLDSLGGRSSLVRDVTMEPGLSEVVLLIVRAIWLMRSSTQPADSRASASWSQHSSMVSHIWLRPCGGKNNVGLQSQNSIIELETGKWTPSRAVTSNHHVTHSGNGKCVHDILQEETLLTLLTGCLSQQSLMTGRIFLCTTTSCRSSREGCWPISSSNGSMYSPRVTGGRRRKLGLLHEANSGNPTSSQHSSQISATIMKKKRHN